MANSHVEVHQLAHRITPNPKRVITRFFGSDEEKTKRRIARVLTLSESEAQKLLNKLESVYRESHPDIEDVWLVNYERATAGLAIAAPPTRAHQLLGGAYFTMEYAIESAALFNPSIVGLVDQEGVTPGCTRFVMSLRAIGEGHLSSVVFRMGEIDEANNIIIEPQSSIARQMKVIPDAEFETAFFRNALDDLQSLGPLECQVLDNLGESFSLPELKSELHRAGKLAPSKTYWKATVQNMLTLAASNYRLSIPQGIPVSEIVIFPTSQKERHGIEDLRLVRFHNDDGSACIYGTYTAFNGISGIPSFLVTHDLQTVESHTMAGPYAVNKGMALFPRKINGNYVMSGRSDGENLYIMESDNPLVWNRARSAQEPKYWWEFSVIGNCGSPIETPEGWLLLTHGVGPMREYCIGAALLDLDDPAKEIGRTKDPLIMPNEHDRTGYVPNVVYTCGSMLHNGSLILPYAMSDWITTFARIDMAELLHVLKST